MLLFKSNTHLDIPGATYLAALVKLLIADVKPSLILSLGTAGGASPADHVGTIRAISADTLYAASTPSSSWPVYSSTWKASDLILDLPAFAQLAFPIPTIPGPRIASHPVQHALQHHLYPGRARPRRPQSSRPVPKFIDQTGGCRSFLKRNRDH